MDITKVKQFSNFQTNYMFKVWIPSIALIEGTTISYVDGLNFNILSRGLDLPGLIKAYKNIRFLNSQVAIPFGESHEGEITLEVIMDQDHKIYDLLVKWYKSINSKNIPNYTPYSVGYLELTDFQGNRTNIFKINNMSPKAIPALTGLNYENIDGFITLSVPFGYDNIDYDLPRTEIPSFE